MNSQAITKPAVAAIKVLQDNLLVNQHTAAGLLGIIYSSSSFPASRINELLEQYLPLVIEYYVNRLNTGERFHSRKSERPDPIGSVAFLPSTSSFYAPSNPELQFHIEFGAEFQKFYMADLVDILGDKLEHVLFAVLDLNAQLGWNVKKALTLMSSLEESGLAQIQDFTYANKAWWIEEIVTGGKPNKHQKFNDIPDAVQQAFLSPECRDQLVVANNALKDALLVGTTERMKILQTLKSDEILCLPSIAYAIRDAALFFKISDGMSKPAHHLRSNLIYGITPIVGFESQLSFAKLKIRTFSEEIGHLLVNDKFLNTVSALPKIPCEPLHPDCFDMNIQRQNLDELVRGFNALAVNQTLVPLQFETLRAPKASTCLFPGLNLMGIAMALTCVTGLCVYMARTWGRRMGMWGDIGKAKKEEPSTAAERKRFLSNDRSDGIIVRRV